MRQIEKTDEYQAWFTGLADTQVKPVFRYALTDCKSETRVTLGRLAKV